MANRRYERKRIDVRIHVEGEELSGDIWFDTEDLSIGGAYLVSDFLFEKDTRLIISFKLGEHPIEIDTRVVWVNLGMDEKMKERKPGMGLEFGQLGNEAREKIERFISNKA